MLDMWGEPTNIVDFPCQVNRIDVSTVKPSEFLLLDKGFNHSFHPILRLPVFFVAFTQLYGIWHVIEALCGITALTNFHKLPIFANAPLTSL
jgi:hypothetical protein